MADIEIVREHGKSFEDARNVFAQIEKKLTANGVSVNWISAEEATLKGPLGVSGSFKIDATHVRVSIKLGFAAKLMKDQIKSSIDRQFDKALT